MVESTNESEKCRVLWSNGSSYDAFVIFKGIKLKMCYFPFIVCDVLINVFMHHMVCS